MRDYRGLKTDTITGGGAYVRMHGYGFEIFNFLPMQGLNYGFVQCKGKIRIERLGASDDADSIDNVLVVWVAKAPEGGARLIGWYNNATVFRNYLILNNSNRTFKGREVEYNIKAREEDCHLLPIDERTFRIPTNCMGGMGQSNVWYANEKFKELALQFINEHLQPKCKQKEKRLNHIDPFRKKKIEERAIQLTISHYERMGYQINSVEKDNVGWDLEAVQEGILLKLEVKGLSQGDLQVELTPNEYDKMNKHKNSYRICIVTNTLSKPCLSVFSYSPDHDSWKDAKGVSLKIVEKTGAKLYGE